MSNDFREPTADETAKIKAAVEELLLEIKRTNEQMERDQEEIDRLRAQTRATLARLETA